MSVPNDFEPLLQAARTGSNEALGDVLEACRAYLLLVANKELNPALWAKTGPSDLVQQTFLEAQQDFDQFRGATPQELRAWLRQILRNNVSNTDRRFRGTSKRQLGREVALDPGGSSGDACRGLAAETLSPSGEAASREQVAALTGAIQRLPDDYQKVVRWRYRDNKSFEEIAGFLNRSENAVRKLWFRAVERLQKELDEHE